MGRCGCSDYRPEYRFPGTNDVIYTVERISGCRYCEECPKGTRITRTSKDELELLGINIKDIPSIDFTHNDFILDIMTRDELSKQLEMGLDGLLEDKNLEYLKIVVEELVQNIFE